MKNAVNIRVLAQKCGISTSTASRIMNYSPDKAGASRELYDKVHQVADEIGYRPNYLARAMFTHKTNLVGFISGYTSMVFGPLLEGLASVLTPCGKGLFVYPCRNEQPNEVQAIDRMIYQKMDAIIYYSILYPGEHSDRHVLEETLKKYPSLPPIVELFGCNAQPHVYQLRIDDPAIGRRAALRQLELGCRKFGILNTNISSFRSLDAINHYRDTLIAHGVKQENIATLHAPMPPSAEDMAPLKDIDGLWCSFMMVLPSCLHALEKVCDVTQLHADAFSSFETTEMFRWLLPAVYSEDDRRAHPFKSLYLSLISMYDFGARAAEIIIKELNEPTSTAPRTEYFDNTYCSFDERMKTRVFF